MILSFRNKISIKKIHMPSLFSDFMCNLRTTCTTSTSSHLQMPIKWVQVLSYWVWPRPTLFMDWFYIHSQYIVSLQTQVIHTKNNRHIRQNSNSNFIRHPRSTYNCPRPACIQTIGFLITKKSFFFLLCIFVHSYLQNLNLVKLLAIIP